VHRTHRLVAAAVAALALTTLAACGGGSVAKVGGGNSAPTGKPEKGGTVTLAEVGKGHHFSGEYSTLAERILAFARTPQPAT